jgi:serine/threonine-protein phosphatase 2A regulatory subunit A
MSLSNNANSSGGGGGSGGAASVVVPMDVDPIDGGPLLVVSPTTTTTAAASSSSSFPAILPTTASTLTYVEMLRSDDVSQRVAAAYRLDLVAAALGEERTRDELIPFLTDGMDDEDEVLLAVATSLPKLVAYVGGSQHVHALLRPLELLLTIEDVIVRQAACEAALQISSTSAAATTEIIPPYLEMLQRLAGKEWFTARISAATLIPVAYPQIPTPTPTNDDNNHDDATKQQVFLDIYTQKLCQDETSMVRRIAAQNLGIMMQNVLRTETTKGEGDSDHFTHILPRQRIAEIIQQQFIPLYREFASPEQPDAVRLQTTENCVAFGTVLAKLPQPLTTTETQLLQTIIPILLATIDDRSWRVRWTAAAKFAQVVTAYDGLVLSNNNDSGNTNDNNFINNNNTMDALIPGYEKLLQDPEAEVRTAATFNLAQVARAKGLVIAGDANNDTIMHHSSSIHNAQQQQQQRVSVAERLVKKITSLTEDDSEHVRAALAKVATELAPLLGKDATITYLVPPVLLLLRDAASEVRLNLISSLSSLNSVIGVDLLSQSLLPAILDLAQDGKWRIRMAIIEHIPLLAEQLGKEFFTEKLSTLCVGWLGDDIASIRNAAAENLKALTALFGTEWAIEHLIPSLVEIREHHSSYLRRLTALRAIALMGTVMDEITCRNDILPIIIDMATDVVPNIRFNVAKHLELIAPVCGIETYERNILPVLTMLMEEDDDRDVRYYAEKAATALEQAFATSAGTVTAAVNTASSNAVANPNTMTTLATPTS